MTRIFMIRHGKSAAGFDEALDADLSELGHRQAAIAAAAVARRLPPMPIIASPFQRARSTAEPLARAWRQPMAISPEITEIPTPPHLGEENLAARRPWLTAIMASRYGNLGDDIEIWRQSLIDFVANTKQDSILFTHYLTINAIVGAAQNDDRVALCDPGYCTVTELEVCSGQISVIGIGLDYDLLPAVLPDV
ncbi:putative Phosphoglycerate mutase (plasmid) [Azospirillum lipoferum 4B]|uniref:Phosphoglycerate mutase n=2 Tax=Azospirillum lipoferum TaxID=193 RepID=G7ZIK5_AZOL4|nr:putative Phosphoglycerate mutase [Azospirillum lipoferum 4B]